MEKIKHSALEDVIAMASACFIVAQGVFFLQQGGLLTGGTTGLALLMGHYTGLSFGKLYFACNLPFYFMAWWRISRRFALNSILCGGAVSVMVDHIPMFFTPASLDPAYCAVIGGLLLGVGMLMLFRHHASLGGINVLAVYCQERFGVKAGNVQMVFDSAILIASFFMVSPWIMLWSVAGAVIINMVLTMNHRNDRYLVVYAK